MKHLASLIASLGCLWAANVPAAEPPIRSRAQLDAYLADHPADSPLAPLSAGARERFLYSLRFGAQGLSGADGGDLSDELTTEQIRAVFAMFGPEFLQYAPESRVDEVRSLEKRVRSRDNIGDVERRFNDYYRAMKDIGNVDDETRTKLRAQAFDSNLDGLYEPKALTRVDDRELRLLRRAAHDTARATLSDSHIAAFAAVFAERKNRSLISSGDLETQQALFLAQRRFADARRLAHDFPGVRVPRLPSFRDPVGAKGAGPTLWRLDTSGRELTREPVDLTPTQILVTASCHFSKDAARDIAADAVLGPVFARHARWLSPAPGIEPVDAAKEWNASLPHTPIAMIYDRQEWRMLPAWRMPEFYVIREGKVLESVHGWQSGSVEQREKLLAMLRRHGLLESP